MALIIMCAPRAKILPVNNALNEFPFFDSHKNPQCSC